MGSVGAQSVVLAHSLVPPGAACDPPGAVPSASPEPYPGNPGCRPLLVSPDDAAQALSPFQASVSPFAQRGLVWVEMVEADLGGRV